MKFTQSEKEYLAQVYQEFGCLLGKNWDYSIMPKQPRPKVRPLSSLTVEERRSILELRLKHIPYRDIIAVHNITAQSIWQIQRDAGYRWESGNLIG